MFVDRIYIRLGVRHSARLLHRMRRVASLRSCPSASTKTAGRLRTVQVPARHAHRTCQPLQYTLRYCLARRYMHPRQMPYQTVLAHLLPGAWAAWKWARMHVRAPRQGCLGGSFRRGGQILGKSQNGCISVFRQKRCSCVSRNKVSGGVQKHILRRLLRPWVDFHIAAG